MIKYLVAQVLLIAGSVVAYQLGERDIGIVLAFSLCDTRWNRPRWGFLPSRVRMEEKNEKDSN